MKPSESIYRLIKKHLTGKRSLFDMRVVWGSDPLEMWVTVRYVDWFRRLQRRHVRELP